MDQQTTGAKPNILRLFAQNNKIRFGASPDDSVRFTIKIVREKFTKERFFALANGLGFGNTLFASKDLSEVLAEIKGSDVIIDRYLKPDKNEAMKYFQKVEVVRVHEYQNESNKARFPDGLKIDYLVGYNMNSPLAFSSPSIYQKIKTTMENKHPMFVFPYFRFKNYYYKTKDGYGVNADRLLADFGKATDLEMLFPVSTKVYNALKKTIEKYSLIVVTL